jgi:hypothetical protein
MVCHADEKSAVGLYVNGAFVLRLIGALYSGSKCDDTQSTRLRSLLLGLLLS